MSDRKLPPLPSGFVLEQSAPSSGGNLPPLPPGFVLEEPAPEYRGLLLNTTAGINSAIYSTLGLPSDLTRGAVNFGIRGVNAALGTDIAEYPESATLFGSKSIGDLAGAIDPVLNPVNTAAKTTGERLARGVGEGVGYSVAPEALIGGGLSRAAGAGSKVSEAASRVLGRTASGGQAASNIITGGLSGLGATAAMEVAPEEYKPLAGMVGGLAVGIPAAVATSPEMWRAVKDAAADYIAPLTRGGRERLAGQRLVDAATAPETSRLRLAEGADELVPGSEPTTFQASGDMGLGGLERGIAAKFPDKFNQRRADQNAARVGAVEGLQPGGAPEAVARAVKARLADIEAESNLALREATDAAIQPAAALGTGLDAPSAGEAMRSSLEGARSVAKARERELWKAVDPDDTLAMPVSGLRAKASEIRKSMPFTAKPMTGEEDALHDVLVDLEDVVSFADVTALQSRIKAAMRDERMTAGESPVYRRLVMLNDAVESDMTAAITKQAKADEAAISAGKLKPEESLSARVAAIGAPSVGDAVFTPSGRRVDVRYEVVDGSALRTSSGADGRADPAYPGALQPRDRSRAASDAQISDISRNLQPERLGPSSSASEGAPIVGPDGIVESGNGRVLGIRGAYRENGQSAKAYRDYLARQGYDVSGMREPVLIRRRTSDLSEADRVRFAQEANAPSSLAMSASEQAATDASRLDRGILDLYRGGDVSSPENRDFARAFLGKVSDKGQEGTFVTGSGTLSLDGARRMRNALLQSAYRDGPLVASLVDAGDDNIRAFGRALSDISGDVAKLRAGIDAGDVDAVADVSGSLVDAARIVASARDRGVRLFDAVAQQDAFTTLSPSARRVLEIAYGKDLSARLSRENLTEAMRDAVAEAQQQTASRRLFGDALTADQILEGVQARYGSRRGGSIPGPADFAGGNVGGQADRQPRPLSAGEGDGGGIGSRAPGSAHILERPGLEPNFDQGARDRLTAARSATKDRVETFDNRTLGPIRRRPGTTAPYDMPAGSVPSRIFNARPDSPEAIAKFRRAVGDAEALPVLREYAIDRVRHAALREDGTLDPGKLATWRKMHAAALKALPELDAQLSTAAKASEALASAAKVERQRLAEYQVGKVGQILKIDDPQDVVRTVGNIFGRQDSIHEMMRVRSAIGSDREAQKGLRRAVVDHVLNRFVGNTEAGTSGLGTMKSDAFQTFVRQNKPALRVAGFGDAEIDLLESVADDLQRANRSVASVKLPGGSNTAQDTYAMAKGATAISRLIHAAVAPGAGVGAGTALGGPLGAAIGGLGGVALDSIRRAGFERVDELVADALLHPGRARVLMMKARPGKETAAWQMIARAYALKAARPSVAVSADQLDGDPDNGGSAVRQPLEITVRPKGKQGRIQPPNGGLGGLGGMAAQR